MNKHRPIVDVVLRNSQTSKRPTTSGVGDMYVGNPPE